MAFDDPSRRDADAPEKKAALGRVTWVRARDLPVQFTGGRWLARAVQVHDQAVRVLPRLPAKALEWSRMKHDQRVAARQERVADEQNPFSTPDEVTDPSAGPEGVDLP